ncbi:S8 family peptidase [Heyndrickxia acidicola]|uniref:S8 family serine peptidase n=1 Tax=Heyndrickxia acidicola TaxID=209389 RepID=A0ABU6MF35_9BACI|nr:S8 family serine peptidase [Heyndrickxia acidicola]MED1203290.1 S8 family serine peptidase [Heyndrickxia acidicola]
MKKIPLLLTFLAVCLAGPAIAHGSEKPPKEGVMIGFNGKTNEQELEKYGMKIDHVFNSIRAVSGTISPAAKQAVEKLPNIKWVESNQTVRMQGQVPTSGLSTVKSTQAESLGLTGKGVKVAVIDTGIDLHHPDLHVAGGVSEVGYTRSYNDDNGHGTHVAGIIGALNNSIGVVGVAPDVSLYAVKALDQDGKGDLGDIIAGIDWAIRNHMNIINLSLTIDQGSQALQAEVNKAYSKGVIVVAAAGNIEDPDTRVTDVLYPARYSTVISVGSIDRTYHRSSFSYYGKDLDFMAPGENILSTFINPRSKSNLGYYQKDTGTSMATPYVSGVFALYKQAYPSLGISAIEWLAEKNAKDLGAKGKDKYYGYGLIQAPKVPYTDISPTSSYAAYIDDLYSRHILKPTQDGTFQPTGTITRADAVSMIGMAKNWNGTPRNTAFSDVPASNPASGYISSADAAKAIEHKYQNNLFNPEWRLLRGDAAFMLATSFNNPMIDTQAFKDVNSSMSFYEQANALVKANIIRAYADGTFKPETTITKQDFVEYLAKELH